MKKFHRTKKPKNSIAFNSVTNTMETLIDLNLGSVKTRTTKTMLFFIFYSGCGTLIKFSKYLCASQDGEINLIMIRKFNIWRSYISASVFRSGVLNRNAVKKL